MILEIHVTQSNIDNARHYCEECPVALAIVEALAVDNINGTASVVRPHPFALDYEVYFSDKYIEADCILPQKVNERIAAWDSGCTIYPFDFVLEVGQWRVVI